MRRTVVTRVCEAVKAISLCHNVTPVADSGSRDVSTSSSSFNSLSRWYTDVRPPFQSSRAQKINYQASSPDEIALVSWTESVGLTLIERDMTTITLRSPHDTVIHYTVLQVSSL
jgi:phospholipid-translocating ATPase